MLSDGYAQYEPTRNRLEVVRPGENCTRYIDCINLNPRSDKVFAVQIDGDEIWVLIGHRRINALTVKLGIGFPASPAGMGMI